MYEFIRGKLIYALPHKTVVEVSGVGYKIAITPNIYAKLPQVGSEVNFFVSFIVREDAQMLYGFLTLEEREFFEKLIALSGIGPKTGQAFLGALELPDLQLAILNGDTVRLSKVPGVGKKTAERIVVELRDKVQEIKKSLPLSSSSRSLSVPSDAVSALMNLGYNMLQAQKVVRKVLEEHSDELSLPEVIKHSLKLI